MTVQLLSQAHLLTRSCSFCRGSMSSSLSASMMLSRSNTRITRSAEFTRKLLENVLGREKGRGEGRTVLEKEEGLEGRGRTLSLFPLHHHIPPSLPSQGCFQMPSQVQGWGVWEQDYDYHPSFLPTPSSPPPSGELYTLDSCS